MANGGRTSNVLRFRGLRQLVGNVIICLAALIMMVIMGIAVVTSPPNNAEAEWGGLAVSIVGAAAFVGLLLRMRVAFTVVIDPEVLTYRSLLRTFRYRRAEVLGIGLEERHKGLALLPQPYLNLRDGRQIWLADMGQENSLARGALCRRT